MGAFWAIQQGINGVMQSAFKAPRAVWDSRKTSKYKDEAGNEHKLNPARRVARRLKNDVYQMGGVKRNMRGEIDEAAELSRTDRLAGAGHLVGDTLFAPLTLMGWGVRGGTKLAAVGGLAIGIPTAKAGVKATTAMSRETINYVGDTAMAAGDLIGAMNKSYVGREMLFAGGTVGALGVSAASTLNGQWSSDAIGKAGMQFYNGREIDQLPGTVMPSSTSVETGADGDLVFAMHNMR